ncbi:MAG: alpha/beta hydrolase [Acidobacteria bacterium]|jgi:pimeloyl-ACP methyl ester carboxylesterase|nr:alpha/beta hydrolase [Acidobacteriota bacterium]MDP7472679.1 alpha/beta hydrolase [Vicinamibacterales bacterium]MDP7691091.1 alpha/beta hydrolase [Vicinamibacterales bacterium]HJN42791.1 alpha/beta hydrolase [Vicinamibacterales bacterium]|tara:strand:- start:189 stop:1016 length:828 start_codon:yes stop_codon:yes gene_type:complete
MRIATIVVAGVLLVAAASTSAQGPTHAFMTASDGVRIHYAELGSGTPVILIHGYTANAEGKWFKPGIAQALAKRHRVVAIDARGHGQSEKPHDPMKYGPQMADDVIELMDHLDIERAHIHGYSMGGSILTQVLARHPDRVITAIYGGSGVREVDPAWQARVPDDPETPDDLPRAPRSENWSGYPGFDRTALDAVRNYPWEPDQRAIDLTTVDIPVLAIVGGYDRPNDRTHRLSRELSDFELVVLPGETHGSAHFNPRYTEALVEFVRTHDTGATE